MRAAGADHFGHLWLFSVLVFGIIVVPGMDMAFVMARALADGRRAGFAAVAGIIAGGMAHVLMALIGIGLLLSAAPGAFALLLIVGSAYIAWIGWSIFKGAGALEDARAGPPSGSLSLGATFLQAMATCLLNPKAYIFTLAVFPQFLRPEHGSLALQALALGSIIAATQGVVYGAIAVGASGLRTRLSANPAAQTRLGQAVGLTLILAAAWTAWHGLRAL